MTKTEYMKKLAHDLRRLPKEDYDRAIEYFEEYFAEAGPENEQQAVSDLGSPEEAAKELIIELAAQNIKEKPKTVKRGLSTLWIAILALCAAPVTVPFAICTLIVLAVILLCVGIVLFTVAVSAIAFIASGILSLFGGIAVLFHSVGDGLCNIGLGLFASGIGILIVYGVILLFKWCIRKTSVSLGKMTKGGKKHEKNN